MYIKKSKLLVLILSVVLATSIATACLMNPFGADGFSEFIKFKYVAGMVESQYYEDVNPTQLMNYALTGLCAGTGDPYTAFYFDDYAEAYMNELSGNYQGVGLYVSVDASDNTISVVSAIAGTPAAEAGIVTGDKIISIDGQAYSGDQLSEAVDHMLGEAGTSVALGLKRAKTGEIEEISVVRRDIELVSVEYKTLDNETGEISISEFADNTAKEFRNAVSALKEKGVKKLIIDLRNNPGGYLDQAVEIADVFLNEGDTIVYTEDKRGRREYYNAEKDGIDMKVAILINGGSASASEALSGALHDHGIAALIGEKSYGKGIVQSVYTIGNRDALSITTARYYTPNGVCIHGTGIEPDVEVKADYPADVQLSELKPEEDAQLQEAIKQLNNQR